MIEDVDPGKDNFQNCLSSMQQRRHMAFSQTTQPKKHQKHGPETSMVRMKLYDLPETSWIPKSNKKKTDQFVSYYKTTWQMPMVWFLYIEFILIIHVRTLKISDNFFSIWAFHKHSQFTGQQGNGKAISLRPLYNFHLFHRHLDISWVITAESSPLHIASKQTQTRNLWIPSPSP